jgi:hypothetical protein
MEVRSRPDIRTNYVSKREREPNSYMEVKEQDFDRELELKRKHDPNRFVDPMENCTFKPEIYHKGDNKRGIDDLYEWEMARKDKIATQRLSKLQNVP